MNHWLHRISYLENVSYPLLEKGYLSIGFSDFANEEFLKSVSNKDWDYFEEQFDTVWEDRPRSRYSLWRFIAEMEQNDLVLVPHPWQTFSVYKIAEPHALIPPSMQTGEAWEDWNGLKISQNKEKMLILEGQDAYLDIGFLRKVKPVAIEIPRYEYADAALTARMKIRQTNANVSDLQDSVKTALEAFKQQKPVNFKNMLLENSVESWLEIIRSSLNPAKFETLVKLYFERIGASSIETHPAGNSPGISGDVDIAAGFEALRAIINVQVKFYQGETSEWPVQQIKDYVASIDPIRDGYLRMYWVISSSDSFSKECKKLAVENDILLIDGREFVRMLIDAGMQNITGI
jgi:predicted Mrr-cat superfamily restriction endonuclease